ATPVPVDVPILRAEARMGQGDPAAARGLLEAACKEYPERAEPTVALAALVERQEGPEAALRVLDEAQGRLGDRAEIRLARAWTWARRGGEGAPATLAKLTQDLAKFSADDQVRLLRGLVDPYLRIGDRREARRILDLLADRQPHDLDVRLVAFD